MSHEGGRVPHIGWRVALVAVGYVVYFVCFNMTGHIEASCNAMIMQIRRAHLLNLPLLGRHVEHLTIIDQADVGPWLAIGLLVAAELEASQIRLLGRPLQALELLLC